MARDRKLYLDGVKGIACLLIMLGHFSGIYKYAIDALEIECGFLKSFSILPISILTAESFWLYLFFAISGYLVASSSVLDIWDVLRKAAVRVIRFLLPVIGVVVIVFLLQIGIGFHNQELKFLIDNPWYFPSYQNAFTLKDLALEPIKVFVLGSSKFDSPIWVMRDMLLASFLIYGIICMTKSDKPVVIRGGVRTNRCYASDLRNYQTVCSIWMSMRSMWKVAGVLPSKDFSKRIIRMGNELSINWCVLP